ncbi:hypothetical protein F4819DRAFT_501976 [Hypoxylon fuscum]|nr:hypothetical protein F4819DRAFT_501976 [Hypoxylon fuscum]
MEPAPDLTGENLTAGKAPLTQEQEEYFGELYTDQYYKRINLTYGVELQFLVPVLKGQQDDPHPTDTRFVTRVAEEATDEVIFQTITEMLLQGIRNGRAPAWTHRGPLRPRRNELSTMDQESQAVADMPKYSQWVVEVAQDLVPQNDAFGKLYTWVGVKIRTNKRNSAWPSHFDLLADIVVFLRNDLRLRLPPTTSFMVHVGEEIRDIMAYEIGPRWLRTFVTLMWFIEDHILLLCHQSRRTHPACMPLRRNSKLAVKPHDELIEELTEEGLNKEDYEYWYNQMQYITPKTYLDKRARDEVESIWRSKDAKTLLQKLASGRTVTEYNAEIRATVSNQFWGRGSVGFQGFCQDALREGRVEHNNGHTGTIEFRSMEGTLDPILMLHWITICLRLIDFSRRGNTADVMAIIARSTGPYGGLNLLQDLGLQNQAIFFGTRASTYGPNITQETRETLFVAPYT